MTDWGGLRTIIDNPPEIVDQLDCPICGEVLDYNGELWNCPRQGARHYRAMSPPMDTSSTVLTGSNSGFDAGFDGGFS